MVLVLGPDESRVRGPGSISILNSLGATLPRA